jgi:hypothetical protein
MYTTLDMETLRWNSGEWTHLALVRDWCNAFDHSNQPSSFFIIFSFNSTAAPQKKLCSTRFVTILVYIRFEVPNWNGVLTWIWDASCVPQVAFHAARPGTDQGWGWWQDSDHSCCRSSTRSPGAGDAPAGFCGTHRHISFIRFSMTPNL